VEIPRPRHEARVRALLKSFPVVAILGARQVGKTTLARRIGHTWPGEATAFDLEDAGDLARLQDPMLALTARRGLVVLDEVQRRPDLFPALRVLADRPRRPARFLVLGSASPGMLRQSSESLAGRIAFHELGGFSIEEVGIRHIERLPAFVPGSLGRPQPNVASPVHPDVPRARPPAARGADPGTDPGALLGDARPLSRAGVELE
jgi:predicted AAA+ superfamily ATPase